MTLGSINILDGRHHPACPGGPWDASASLDCPDKPGNDGGERVEKEGRWRGATEPKFQKFRASGVTKNNGGDYQ
ncbi:hypothetical protein [Devosia sp.]|uniref:hypothetical protein n=1 Tax=Devosia sp. TaxID=1871048 RepID=UPI0025D12432|nr:hypothetical protein [Devosia sp.]MCR6635850.1 hypothetical protein [Devosia sp.]